MVFFEKVRRVAARRTVKVRVLLLDPT